MTGSITSASGLGIALVWTPTPSLRSAEPSPGRVRTTPTGYLGSSQKKEYVVSGVCVGSSPRHAISTERAAFIKHGHFNLVNLVSLEFICVSRVAFLKIKPDV